MNYVALICARGGSKGLPGKNIKPLAGTPLIGWAIKAAQQTPQISSIIVSTDSEQIAQVAVEQGAEVPFMRPVELAQDHSSEWLVWRHAVEYLEQEKTNVDGLVVVPATAPLREAVDLENCIRAFETSKADVVVTVTDAHRSPYFNMLVQDEEGYSSLVIPPDKKIFRRQDAPVVYDMTTVAYVLHSDVVKTTDRLFDNKLVSVYVPPERAIDIDTALDFKIAECLMSERLKNE